MAKSKFERFLNFKSFVSVLALIYMFGVIISGLLAPLKLKPHPFLLHSLMSGDDHAFITPASELKILKPYLPANGFFSFIMDVPYVNEDDHADYREFFWKAQNYVIPIVLNRNPGETEAIVFCQNDSIANQRLEETGYEWLHKIADGKGIAIKKK